MKENLFLKLITHDFIFFEGGNELAQPRRTGPAEQGADNLRSHWCLIFSAGHLQIFYV